jgi:hypothetical protein
MSFATDADHLSVFKRNSVIFTSSTDAREPILRRIGGAGTGMVQSDTPASSSTKQIISSKNIERELEQLFHEFRHEVFEDGIESDFSQRLLRMIETKGNMALLELDALLRSPSTPLTVSAEALRWLGQMRDRETHAYRRWILTDLLKAPSLLIRDGAIVGLLTLDDPSIKHSVRAALASEPSEQLRRDLSQLLDQLEMPEQHYALFAEENT